MALSGNSRKLPFEVIRVSLFIQIYLYAFILNYWSSYTQIHNTVGIY